MFLNVTARPVAAITGLAAVALFLIPGFFASQPSEGAPLPSPVPPPAAGSLGMPYLVDVPPLGLTDSIPEPEDNLTNPSRIALGKSLFFDPLLSEDGTVSCGSCHRPDHGFSSPDVLSEGVRGRKTSFHTPTLFNRAWGKRFMWDGRFQSLEEQVLEPISNENEMNLPLESALARLRESREYRKMFGEAYGEEITRENLAKALAGFVRRISIGNSPVDHFREGRVRHLSSEAKAGLWIFESRGQCWRCHNGPNFADERLHNTGVGVQDGRSAPGRFAATGNPEHQGQFKTPTLRGLVHTAPYMHDGSFETLEDVVEFYRRGGEANPHLAPEMAAIDLSEDDARKLVAFLRALSEQVEITED